VVEKVRKTITKYQMFHRGQTIGVAVSGGKDSLSLLRILHALNGTRNELVVLSVDEGVAGYREEAIAHAQKVVGELGFKHVVLSYKELFGFSLDEALDWEADREISSCSFCGVFRRRAIDQAAQQAGVDVVATAHNLDDFVQTFLMNLLHGDVDRLPSLDPSPRDDPSPLKRVKPFMELYEEEVALYAFLTGIPFQSVSCPYMHEGLRSEVRDYLNQLEANHPGMKNVLLSSSLKLIKGTEDASRAMVPCASCGGLSSSGLCNVCRMKGILSDHVKYPQKKSVIGGG
jgi:cytoplasmic tRNA 2-thiolation protein 1